MIIYRNLPRNDYDQTIKLEGTKIPCYSKKKMDKLYSEESMYTIVGETKRKNKKDEIATLNVWRSKFIVSKLEDNSKVFYRKAGFVAVGPDQYVVLLKHRFAFLFWFFGLLLGLLLAGLLLWSALFDRPEPTIIDPDHPLPSEDPYAEALPEAEAGGEKADSEDGGGSVSMIYTLSAEVTLSTGQVRIYFRNPTDSNHDIKLVLYALSGGKEYPLAQSGLLKAGNGLETMELIEGAAQLQSGTYSGKYKLYYYDSLTGEKALVEPEITDLVITVNP